MILLLKKSTQIYISNVMKSSPTTEINHMCIPFRNYFDVLANNCGSGPPPGPKTSSELTQDVLESLFYTRKSSKHEPGSMNWRNVVKKMESFGQMLDYPSEDTTDTTKKQQHVFGNQNFVTSVQNSNQLF